MGTHKRKKQPFLWRSKKENGQKRRLREVEQRRPTLALKGVVHARETVEPAPVGGEGQEREEGRGTHSKLQPAANQIQRQRKIIQGRRLVTVAED